MFRDRAFRLKAQRESEGIRGDQGGSDWISMDWVGSGMVWVGSGMVWHGSERIHTYISASTGNNQNTNTNKPKTTYSQPITVQRKYFSCENYIFTKT